MGAKAVVSTIHIKHLIDMAPHDAWPEDFHYGVETYDIGITNMGVYIAAREAPKFKTRGGVQSAVSAGLVGWPEDIIRVGRDVKDGSLTAADLSKAAKTAVRGARGAL